MNISKLFFPSLLSFSQDLLL